MYWWTGFSVEVRDLCFSKENELFICYFSQLFVIFQSVLVKNYNFYYLCL